MDRSEWDALVARGRADGELHADQIAVLDQGQVVATGSHQELLRDSELYARLARLQFREPEDEAS